MAWLHGAGRPCTQLLLGSTGMLHDVAGCEVGRHSYVHEIYRLALNCLK